MFPELNDIYYVHCINIDIYFFPCLYFALQMVEIHQPIQIKVLDNFDYFDIAVFT